jgi:hypothetical protein
MVRKSRKAADTGTAERQRTQRTQEEEEEEDDGGGEEEEEGGGKSTIWNPDGDLHARPGFTTHG